MKTGTHQLTNRDWHVESRDAPNRSRSVEHAILATLMDIRTELRAINNRLDCHETLSIPLLLRRISANTHKPRKRRTKVQA